MKKKYILLIFAILFCLLVFFLRGLKEYKEQTSLAQFPRGGDFSLPATKDDHFSLLNHRGKVVVLYFGYTFCPDVCPTTLATVGTMLSSLSTAELDQVKTIFIGVDTKRDTIEKLKKYTAFFHPTIIGLSGSETQIRDVAKMYGVNYVINEVETGKDYYTVDHSTQLFVLDKKGEIAELIPHGESAEKIKQVILEQLKGKE